MRSEEIGEEDLGTRAVRNHVLLLYMHMHYKHFIGRDSYCVLKVDNEEVARYVDLPTLL